jgi:hypothetical protein
VKEHQHAWKGQGPAIKQPDTTRVRVKRCRCGAYKVTSRKPRYRVDKAA